MYVANRESAMTKRSYFKVQEQMIFSLYKSDIPGRKKIILKKKLTFGLLTVIY